MRFSDSDWLVSMDSDELEILKDKIEKQSLFLEQWRQPVEPLLFETLRAIDKVFCQELFESDVGPTDEQILESFLLTWGVNKALARMVPDKFGHGPFRLFPSTPSTQQQADEFLLQCGILEKAELFQGWIAEGLVRARSDVLSNALPSGIEKILVLKSDDPSLFNEIISMTHREWMSELTHEFDQYWEKRLEKRHFDILPELVKRVDKFGGWGMTYSTNDEIDEYFLEWGQVYLRRMWGQDLVGPEEMIGRNQFKDYLGLLAALSGRAQKHLCFAAILKRRHPELDLRNLLTNYCNYDDFVVFLAHHLDADRLHIQKLLSNLTLECGNKDIHTKSAEPAWAPVVRSSNVNCILPLYGMEINPFHFLLRDLQAKYPQDWFHVANNRESRWIVDLKNIFRSERWIVRDRNIQLRDEGRTVTDIDFLVYDRNNNELAIFQLKWQQPVGPDNRARRSAGKNLVVEGNKWVAAVYAWLEKYGVDELSRRSKIAMKPSVHVELFVVARYNVFFSGYALGDRRAVWADWNHLLKVRFENSGASVQQFGGMLRAQNERITSSYPGESYAFPIDDLAIILNPTSEPTGQL